MEDVLKLYARPIDPREQWCAQTSGPLPLHDEVRPAPGVACQMRP